MGTNGFYEKKLEDFRKYQSILAESISKDLGEEIDLYEISHSYIIFDDDAKLSIQTVPFKGDYVYMCFASDNVQEKVKFNLEFLGHSILSELVDRLRKCMIIVELRADSQEFERKNLTNN